MDVYAGPAEDMTTTGHLRGRKGSFKADRANWFFFGVVNDMSNPVPLAFEDAFEGT